MFSKLIATVFLFAAVCFTPQLNGQQCTIDANGNMVCNAIQRIARPVANVVRNQFVAPTYSSPVWSAPASAGGSNGYSIVSGGSNGYSIVPQSTFVFSGGGGSNDARQGALFGNRPFRNAITKFRERTRTRFSRSISYNNAPEFISIAVPYASTSIVESEIATAMAEESAELFGAVNLPSFAEVKARSAFRMQLNRLNRTGDASAREALSSRQNFELAFAGLQEQRIAENPVTTFAGANAERDWLGFFNWILENQDSILAFIKALFSL